MILIQQTVQSIFSLIEYWVTNANGTLIFSFMFINILFNVSRNTFGRILTLLVSLGTGILPPMDIPSHKAKLTILSIAYFIANIVYLVAVYLNRTQLHSLSPTVQMGVSFALSLTNTLFFVWILSALDATKKKLEDNNQAVKYKMMQLFTWMLYFVYVSGALAIAGELYLKF